MKLLIRMIPGYSTMNNIKLVPLRDSDREQFILDNQFPDGMFKFEKIMNGGRK